MREKQSTSFMDSPLSQIYSFFLILYILKPEIKNRIYGINPSVVLNFKFLDALQSLVSYNS